MKVSLLLALCALPLSAEETIATRIVSHDAAFETLLSPEAEIEVLASGFDWSEGPVWDAAEQRLLFSDVPNNVVHAWSEKDGLSVYLQPSGFSGPRKNSREPGSNGLAFDAQGRLLTCEHGDRRLSVLTADGGKMTLADTYQGKRFNSPNDLVVHSSGSIFFTDPPYGLPNQGNGPERQLEENGVYRWDENGDVNLVIADLDRPNGVTLSPDEQTLYIAQSHGPAPHVIAYPVQDDLSLGEGRVLFDASTLEPQLPGAPDGLKVDHEGNIWSSGPGGVFIVSPEGKLLGRILTGRRTANLAWGGDDYSVLYLTADHDLLRVQTRTRGPRRPHHQ
ncbi:SMP-30/gluconolactonase/LRE family protein [Roseibacillus ishigakijimensis]|uniref:SMP-30/gluconolactonase/LRE family protein n=1 Tax=Roseibacillus ishigakijimensis TaxID=454146 RepID=A0A934RP44_9BACT|nr:SMP-30/gluconolactonase/LRE family protein [Roseibacillus ishigakijimensis]MBK1834385.1 SMP-30/gluconolactonase/LRE family protein [Roseibacillus ishigakijimensis]